jgi:hypothetical protein
MMKPVSSRLVQEKYCRSWPHLPVAVRVGRSAHFSRRACYEGAFGRTSLEPDAEGDPSAFLPTTSSCRRDGNAPPSIRDRRSLGRGRHHEIFFEGRHHSGYRRSPMGAPSGLCSGSSEVVTSTIGGSTGFWHRWRSHRQPILLSFSPHRHHHRQQATRDGNDRLLFTTTLLQRLVHISPTRRLTHQTPRRFHHRPTQQA